MVKQYNVNFTDVTRACILFIYDVITSAEEGGCVFGAVCLSVCLSVCLVVCLSVCPPDYSQTCEQILTKFF